jgi:hypothetical protein
MKRLTTLFASTVFLLAACKQNPFPETGRIVQREPDRPAPVVPPLVLDVPESTEVLEGQVLEIVINASVPAPGKPLVSVQGLPPGAVFSPETMKITWTPGYDAANDVRDANVILRTYPIKLMLSSSEDPVTITSRSTLLVVRDVQQPMTVSVPVDPIMILEGKLHEQTIEVKSVDFPSGPFQLQIKNMPVGVSILRDLTAQNKFKVSYTPSFREVNFKDTSASWRDFIDKPLEVTAYGPRGTSITANMTWRIKDVREKALLLAPSKINQGTSVSFTVSAEDPNGEEAPSLSLAPRPGFGLAELRTESTNVGNAARGINPSTVATFRWTQIPPEKIGTTADVTIRACVKRSMWAKDLCNDQIVKVTFEQETHRGPVVDRSAFPIGTIKYIRENETERMTLTVRDGEFASTAPSVKINPVSDEVVWNAGRLEITGKKAGLKQFTLTATSVYGVAQSESFLLEVLPWSWSSVLLFGDSPSNAEVKGTQALFESVQIANPVLQLNDPRLLVLRKSVVIGTSAMIEPSAVAPMEKQAATVNDVLINTPLVGKLDGSLKDEISKFDVKIGTRVADLTGYTLDIASGSGLTRPSDEIKLAGKLTGESATPTPVESKAALFTTAKCKTLLVLKKAGEDDLPVAVSCRRPGKGTLIVAGFEFADIQTSPTDNRIVKKWLASLVAQ